MQEKREYQRFRKSYVVSFTLKDSLEKNYDISKLSDISKGGLSFFTIEPYPNGTIFLLKVKFPYHGEDVEMEGEVVNTYKMPNNVYKIGVRFLNLSDQAKKVLEETEQYNQEKSSTEERRQHPRLENKFLTVFYLKEQLDEIRTLNWLQDISQGGMKFFSLEPFSVGETIVFNIQLPYLYPQITAIEGHVLECEEIIVGKTYKIRIQFINLSQEAQLALEKMQ